MKLHIEKCIYGGAGLARADGKTIFVPFTLPGEVVEAHITEDKRSFANAELDAVVEAAQERTTPPCQYFGECGGCQYQHATYPKQVELKLGILQETLERARLKALPEIVPVFSEALGYRNRVRLHLQQKPFALCYKRRAAHANLPVDHCPIAAPILEEAIKSVSHIGEKANLAEDFEEIELFTNEAQNELLLSLWARSHAHGAEKKLSQFCGTLQQELPALTGAAIFSSNDEGYIDKKLAEWGAQSLTYHAGSHPYRVSIGAFFQVNRFLVDRLVELVSADRSGSLMWDLYAGVGLFASQFSNRFEQVIAVEAAPYSSRGLRENLSVKHHKTVQSSTLEFLRQQTRRKDGAKPDLVVVDPPRSGLGRDVTSLLTKVRPQTIVYVSCDPATLSRDLQALVESGYHLRNMHMVDLFPQTFHLESVTVLSLG
jgi:23S rRNA (uracil1939-C5)-methyltransferase